MMMLQGMQTQMQSMQQNMQSMGGGGGGGKRKVSADDDEEDDDEQTLRAYQKAREKVMGYLNAGQTPTAEAYAAPQLRIAGSARWHSTLADFDWSQKR